MVKNLPASTGRAETHVRSLGGEDPLEKDMEAHLSILTWRIHAQMSLAGYCLWSHKELDMTEHKRGHTDTQTHTHTHTHEETADPDNPPAHSPDQVPPPSVLQFVCAVFRVL